MTARRPKRSSHELMAAAVLLVVKKPRTMGELSQLLGVPNNGTVKRYLDPLVDEGLVEVSAAPRTPGRRGYPSKLYTWTGGAS